MVTCLVLGEWEPVQGEKPSEKGKGAMSDPGAKTPTCSRVTSGVDKEQHGRSWPGARTCPKGRLSVSSNNRPETESVPEKQEGLYTMDMAYEPELSPHPRSPEARDQMEERKQVLEKRITCKDKSMLERVKTEEGENKDKWPEASGEMGNGPVIIQPFEEQCKLSSGDGERNLLHKSLLTLARESQRGDQS
ncbi:hypothetical protein P7K49_022571 [Saguinus oedipus]|uniref:Uncharacterized protein n=1 Tax=Saguinus oedipus TaxID=9490 RepID=A0ABQ9UVS6_SAGOE|nr:hypothetical protein P7K49_022571 [Saguinus oedipus]